MASVARIPFSVLGEIRRVIEKDLERNGRLFCDLSFIKSEMQSVDAFIKEDKYDGPVQKMRIRRFQELAFDVEDFVEGLWEPGKYGVVLVAIGADPRPPQLIKLEYFKNTLIGLKDLKSEQSSQVSNSDHDDGPSTEEDCEVIVDSTKKMKIEELLLNPAAELRVISIVGCRGVGKTALARAVYHKDNSHVRDQFEYVAWFEASGCNDKEALLSKAPEKTGKQPGSIFYWKTTPANLKKIAADKRRYLVFIDGVQQEHVWKDTVDYLKNMYKYGPENVRGSRIIVTTSVHSVSSAGGSGTYLYRMQGLGKKESKEIFWRKVYGSDNTTPPKALVTASGSIISKCDGLPLALTSVAKQLSLKGNSLRSRDIKEVEEDLGKLLSRNSEEGYAFRKMRRALVQCYESLPDYDARYCLLYLSIFPMGHHIKSKSLVRRLMAEGLVEAAQDGCKYLNKLIDQCIVDPVQFSGDSRDAKRFKVHGIVLKYIIEESLSRNVVTLITEKGVQSSTHKHTHGGDNYEERVRRLSVQSSTQGKCDEEFEREISSSVRSLTIFNKDPTEIDTSERHQRDRKTSERHQRDGEASEIKLPIDFKKCKMLRLLDLEGCTKLDNKSFQGICELLFLKYLSLRKTGVNKVPTEIKKLKRLETLDIRVKSEIELPIEAIKLPKLAHLFGKFKLSKVSKSKKELFEDFLSNKSNLHTLSGIVVDRKQGPEPVVLCARKLKKIKVWCNETAVDAPLSVPDPDHASRSDDEEGRLDNLDLVIELLKMRFSSLESVSIISGGLSKKFLGSLHGRCTISSIKLVGNLDSLPNKLNEPAKLTKLQLFSTGLSSKDLSALQNLRCLEYLKLAEDGDGFINGVFIVKNGGFESLKRLCIEAPKFPKLQFENGAMENLNSLHLICTDSSKIKTAEDTIEGIEYLKNLSEVLEL